MERSSGPSRGRWSIRRLGAVLFVAVLAAGALGVASAGQTASSPTALLFAHVAVGGAVVALTICALAVARHHSGRGVIATTFTAGAVFSTAVTGAIFLVTGFSNGLDIDRALALVSLGGTVLMMLLG